MCSPYPWGGVNFHFLFIFARQLWLWLHSFLSFFRLCALYVRDLLPICQCVSVYSPSPPGVVYPMLLVSVSKTDSVSRVLEGGFGMRGRSCSGTYPSPCLSSLVPPFPSLAFFLSFFPISPSSSPTTSGSPQEVQCSKMGWFPSSSSLVALSLYRINIEKTPNLTAEWLIQIIVAFSCIRLLFSLTLFLLFFLFLSTVWYLGHLWIRAFERKGRKNEWHQRGRERERGIQNLSSPVIFCSASMIACMTITDKWVNRRLSSL